MKAYSGLPRAFFRLAGKPYVYETLTSSGVKEEGKPHARAYTSPRAAKKAWALMFKKYVRERLRLNYGEKPDGGFVFWRRKPRLDDCGGAFVVSSRLVVIPE